MRLAYYDERVIKRMHEVSDLREGMTVADVGTGTGFVAAGVAPRVGSVIATDNSPAMLDVARKNLDVLSIGNVELLLGEITELPLPSDSVDAAFANMVLHHAPDPEAMLQEMARVVRPGGAVVITDEVEPPYSWMREEHADVWLGFGKEKIEGFFHGAVLTGYGYESLRDNRSIINQREVGTDTASYARALKRILRQDPDIILIGEIRDSESARIALSAAETGHLVLSTLHTLDATETVNRMIDLFLPHERMQVRAMLAGTLKGIVGQRLIRTKGREGRVAACEIMAPDQTDQIRTAIAEGEYYGMQTFDQALLKLVEEDRVKYEDALQVASHPQDFRLMVQSLGLDASR